MNDMKSFLLKSTSSAHDSQVAAEILRYNISKDKIERQQKSALYKKDYKNETVNKIADILFAYAPRHDFWEILIDIFLSDMIEYRFDLSPSINRTDKHIFKFLKDVKNNELLVMEKLNYFHSISLMQHTLDLFLVYEDTLKDYESFKNIDVFALLLSCLLHDFGKNSEIQRLYANTEKDSFTFHHIVSAKYIENKLIDFQKFYKTKFDVLNDVFFSCMQIMEAVKIAVEEHHTKRNLKAKELVSLLIAVDHEARTKEWKDYLNNKGREWIK